MPPDGRAGERRWPMATATLAAGVLHELLPSSFRAAPRWSFLFWVLVLLAVIIIGDPGRIDVQRRWLRVTTGVMIGFITVVNGGSAVRLVAGILTNASFATPSELLEIGGIIWVTNVLAFALWFWDLDAGGAAARAAGSSRVTPALIFPEMTMPEFVPAGWYAQFADYLALSFNTAMAFSPTDVSAVKRWAKLLMMTESAVSLAVAALVIARAINILPLNR